MSLREDKRKERSEAIKQAAFKLFEERGYAGTKIIDIARASGIAKGTFYEYYDGKLEILQEWMKQIFSDFERELDHSLNMLDENSADNMTSISESIRKNIRLVDINFRLLFNALEIKDDDERNTVRDLAIDSMKKEYSRIREVVSDCIARGDIRGQGRENLITCILTISFMMFHKIKGGPDAFPPPPPGAPGRGKEKDPFYGSVRDEADSWTETDIIDLLFGGLAVRDDKTAPL